MLEPPAHVSDADVLDAVRAGWDPDVDTVEHLPVGFGAHHWRAGTSGRWHWFVTLDRPGDRHTATSLEAAYAGAAQLRASGLEFVHAAVPTTARRLTAPLHDGFLSLDPWVDGDRVGDGPPPDRASAETTASMLRRLHATAAQSAIPRWAPFIDPGLDDDLTTRTATPWASGPYGEPARRALRERLTEISGWVTAYHRFARLALDRAWVATHGEPHTRNQLLAPAATLLVDWESLKLAPAERDLRTLVDAGHGDLVEADPAMIALFDLEWRLDEIGQYARWFEAPHGDGPDDRTALAGLRHELQRAWDEPPAG